jgi:hypothetical protein
MITLLFIAKNALNDITNVGTAPLIASRRRNVGLRNIELLNTVTFVRRKENKRKQKTVPIRGIERL